jgi:hypothetical protein
MPLIFDDPCKDGEILTVVGKAPYSVTPNPLGLGNERYDTYQMADVTYSVCVPESLILRLTPAAPITPAPTSSGDSGLAIIVIFALIAQLVVNVIAIRKPTRSRS